MDRGIRFGIEVYRGDVGEILYEVYKEFLATKARYPLGTFATVEEAQWEVERRYEYAADDWERSRTA